MKSYYPIETIEIATLNLTKNVVLISVYISPSSKIGIVKKQFKTLINDYNNVSNVLIAGDVNAHIIYGKQTVKLIIAALQFLTL